MEVTSCSSFRISFLSFEREAYGRMSTLRSIIPSLLINGGCTSSALILHNISVLDAGRNRRDEPLDRMGPDTGDIRVYGLWWRLDLPSMRKFSAHDWRMKLISDGDMLIWNSTNLLKQNVFV